MVDGFKCILNGVSLEAFLSVCSERHFGQLVFNVFCSLGFIRRFSLSGFDEVHGFCISHVKNLKKYGTYTKPLPEMVNKHHETLLAI